MSLFTTCLVNRPGAFSRFGQRRAKNRFKTVMYIYNRINTACFLGFKHRANKGTPPLEKITQNKKGSRSCIPPCVLLQFWALICCKHASNSAPFLLRNEKTATEEKNNFDWQSNSPNDDLHTIQMDDISHPWQTLYEDQLRLYVCPCNPGIYCVVYSLKIHPYIS